MRLASGARMNLPYRAASRVVFVALLLGAAALTVNACSGKTSLDGPSSGTPGTVNDSGTSTQNHPDCPATDPNEGACTKDGLVCEYGDDFNPLCNTIRVCSTNRWASPITYSNRPKCPT